MRYLLAGAALGLAGSVHCAGMCGPLLLAVHRGVPRAQMMARMALYHAARVVTYALLGIPAGYAAHALSFGVFGRIVGAIAGVSLVLAATGPLVTRYGQSLSQVWSATVIRLAAKAAALTPRHPHTGYIVTLSATAVPVRTRQRLRFVAPALMALAGVLLIVRAFGPVEHAHRHEMSAVTEKNCELPGL